MQSPRLKEITQACVQGCCPSPFLDLPPPLNTTSKPTSTLSTCRRDFVASTSSSFFPNTQFTNHESLPSLKESFTQFKKAFPLYSETTRVDQIRAQEYNHLSLSNHICLDYNGIGLFSHSQTTPNGSSSSSPPQYSDFPFFSTLYKSVNLKSQLLHGGPGSELESEYSSGTDTELEQASRLWEQEDDLATTSSFSAATYVQRKQSAEFEVKDIYEIQKKEITLNENEETSDRRKSVSPTSLVQEKKPKLGEHGSLGIKCRGLDHVDSLGLAKISNRVRCLINWLINALMKLQHPYDEKKISLVRIYGPRVKFDRGPALSFNVYDWKGEKVEPALVQKLADRSNISLSNGFLYQMWFSDKYEEEKERVIERCEEKDGTGNRKKAHQGVTVVTAALGFVTNFEDTYRLWAFIARFLDADFVEKERWRYTALKHTRTLARSHEDVQHLNVLIRMILIRLAHMKTESSH